MTKNLADRRINGENPPSLLSLETPPHLKMSRIHVRNAKIYEVRGESLTSTQISTRLSDGRIPTRGQQES